MLFFVVCACFALFPEQVLRGAQTGLSLCINAVIPSLLPFMLISTCLIKSNFSRPLGAVISKILTPLTGMSKSGCVCFISGILGGYGTGARTVYECYRQRQITLNEAEKLMAFCNNAGPLFVIGTVGVGFYASKSLGVSLWLIQVVTALLCASFFREKNTQEKTSLRGEWSEYKKNKPSFGELITESAIESSAAILNVCVFVITFSAVLEILPFGDYPLLSGILEVTRGSAEFSRMGTKMIPYVSAIIMWGGMSVHFQAGALTGGKLKLNKYYTGKVISSVLAFIITKLTLGDMNIFLFWIIVFISAFIIAITIKHFCLPKYTRQCGCRQQPRS